MTITLKHGLALGAALCLLGSAFATSAHAGAWTMPAGTFYDRLSANHYVADQNFNDTGAHVDMSDNGEFRDCNLQNYLEYGLTDQLTLINSLTYKHIQSENDSIRMKTYGVGDIDLGARYKLMEGDFGVLATQALVKIPNAYDRHDDLPLGNGQVDLEGRIQYGKSLYPRIPGYIGMEVGYRLRLEDPSDELRYLVEAGIDITSSLYTRLKLDGIVSIDNGKHRDTSGNPTTTNNFDLAKLDIGVGYKVTNSWGVEAVYTPAVYGQNTAKGSTWTMAITYRNK